MDKAKWTVTSKGGSWYIVHPSKRDKRIGPVKSRGTNYHDKAVAEAKKRNLAALFKKPTKRKKPGARKRAERICAMSGYAYVLRQGPNGTYWDLDLIDGGPAQVMGKRKIDGVEHIVFKRGTMVFAQTTASVKKC